MQTRQVMNKNLVTVPFHTSVQEAASKMKQYNIGSIIVVEDGAKIKGLVTDRDITLKVAADNKDPRSTCVCDIMSTDVITADVDADLDSVVRIMNRAKVMRVPITENGKLIGILSLADLATAMKDQFDQFMNLEEAALKGA